MAVIERDIVMQGMTDDGQSTIDLPVTRLGNIEDTADVKAAPVVGDYLPLIDSADNGQMKKVLLSVLGDLITGKITLASLGAAAATHSHEWSEIAGKPSSFAAAAHASTHRSNGADPITPAAIGAMAQKAVYYSSADTSADDITDGCFLLNTSGTVNSELHEIIGETYAYIVQYYYGNSNQRVQIAHGYTKQRMATRCSYQGTWAAWTPVYNGLVKPTCADIGAAAASDLTTLAGKVAAKAEQSALDSLSAQVATKAASSTLTSLSARVPRITIGSYTGDGMAARTISLGFTPQAVFVCQSNGAVYIAAGTSYHFGGLAFTDNPVKADNSTTSVVAIVTGGFQVTYKSESYTKIMSNTSDKVYYYVAVDYPG